MVGAVNPTDRPTGQANIFSIFCWQGCRPRGGKREFFGASGCSGATVRIEIVWSAPTNLLKLFPVKATKRLGRLVKVRGDSSMFRPLGHIRV